MPNAGRVLPITGCQEAAVELANLEWTRGDDVTLPFTILSAGVAVDITAWAALGAYVRTNLEAAGDPLLTAALGAGISVDVGTNGTGTITFPRADTLTLTAGTPVWFDFWREDAGANVQLARGLVRIHGQNRTVP